MPIEVAGGFGVLEKGFDFFKRRIYFGELHLSHLLVDKSRKSNSRQSAMGAGVEHESNKNWLDDDNIITAIAILLIILGQITFKMCFR